MHTNYAKNKLESLGFVNQKFDLKSQTLVFKLLQNILQLMFEAKPYEPVMNINAGNITYAV